MLQSQVTEVGQTADKATAAVTADWDPAALEPFATPDYLASLTEDSAAWANYRSLGAATAFEPCTVPDLQIENGRGVANANCAVTFENGKASLILGFDNSTGAWKINALKLLL